MARRSVFLVPALVLLGLGGRTAWSAPAPVFPAAAAPLAPLELSALVEKALPRSGVGQLPWSHLLGEPIVWRTDGYRRAAADRALYERIGLARVRLGGRGILRARGGRQELAWTVRLTTRGDPRLGPREVEIAPGSISGCTASGAVRCVFREGDVFRGRLEGSKVCEHRARGQRTVVYTARAPGAADTLVVYARQDGPAGGTARLVIKPFARPAEVCQAAQASLVG